LDLGSDNCTNKPFEFGKGHRVHQKCEIFDEETSAYWNKYEGGEKEPSRWPSMVRAAFGGSFFGAYID